MPIESKDRFCNATLISGKKQNLKDWLMTNVFTEGAKWVDQKTLFEQIKAGPAAVKDLASPALVAEAVDELVSENKLVRWDSGFPA